MKPDPPVTNIESRVDASESTVYGTKSAAKYNVIRVFPQRECRRNLKMRKQKWGIFDILKIQTSLARG
jgi:hypothetical protein